MTNKEATSREWRLGERVRSPGFSRCARDHGRHVTVLNAVRAEAGTPTPLARRHPLLPPRPRTVSAASKRQKKVVNSRSSRHLQRYSNFAFLHFAVALCVRRSRPKPNLCTKAFLF